MTALEIRLGIAAAVLFLLLVAVITWSVHERDIGRASLQHSVDAATAQAVAKAAADTAILQAKAAQADQEARNAQSKLDAYVAAYPLEPVRVCVQASGRPSMPAAASGASPLPSTAPAAGGLPSVSQGAPGPDISAGLAAIVRACGELSVSTRYLQQR